MPQIGSFTVFPGTVSLAAGREAVGDRPIMKARNLLTSQRTPINARMRKRTSIGNPLPRGHHRSLSALPWSQTEYHGTEPGASESSPAAQGHLRRRRSSTICRDIACVARSCICRERPRRDGARNAAPPDSRTGSRPAFFTGFSRRCARSGASTCLQVRPRQPPVARLVFMPFCAASPRNPVRKAG